MQLASDTNASALGELPPPERDASGANGSGLHVGAAAAQTRLDTSAASALPEPPSAAQLAADAVVIAKALGGAARARLARDANKAAAVTLGAVTALRAAVVVPPHLPVTRSLLALLLVRLLTARFSLRNVAVAALGAALLAAAVVPPLVLLQLAMLGGTAATICAWVAFVPPATAVAVANEWDAMLRTEAGALPATSTPHVPPPAPRSL
jgi:hypothetical protein